MPSNDLNKRGFKRFEEEAKGGLVILPITRTRDVEPIYDELPALRYSVPVWGGSSRGVENAPAGD
jgi:hypothetical protein